MQIRKAERKKAKLKMAISGPTGSGKTLSALLIAYGITGDWSKIAVIDTENNSADLYAHLGEYSVISLEPPFTTERYIQAIQMAESAGFEFAIIDSTTHEWKAILEAVDNITQNSNSKNAFSTGWKKMTPEHDRFMNTMLQSKMHIIATMRSKQEYTIVEENGKKVPVKLGLAPVQRDGVEYEFTVHLDMSQTNHAVALKDRTGLFAEQMPFKPTTETGQRILEWCETGVDAEALLKQEVADAIAKLANCEDPDEMTMLKGTLSPQVVRHPDFQEAGKKRYEEIVNKSQDRPITPLIGQ